MSIKKPRYSLLLTAYCLLFTGCLYYNTFYNAKDYYKKAMVSATPNKELLTKSIQKCERIIEYHPKSKYVPEALFIMGKAFFYQEEYSHAQRKFNELIEYYPKSKFIGEAYFILGKTYARQESFSEAEASFAMAKKFSKKKRKQELFFEIINAYLGRGDFVTTIQEVDGYLERFPKTRFKQEVLIIKGNALDSLGQFEKALSCYNNALGLISQDSRRFDILMMIGNDLLVLSRNEQALTHFLELENIPADVEEEVAIKLAECHRRLGQGEIAIKTLKEFEKSQEALYKTGEIYEEEFTNLDTARVYYDKARELSPSSEIGKKALERSSRIGKLKEYREGRTDSTTTEENEVAKQLAKTQFLLAELYFLEFNKPDQAIKEHKKVLENFKDSEYAPKSCYAIAYIYENIKKDKEMASTFYKKTLEEFPETIYAKEAEIAIKRLE